MRPISSREFLSTLLAQLLSRSVSDWFKEEEKEEEEEEEEERDQGKTSWRRAWWWWGSSTCLRARSPTQTPIRNTGNLNMKIFQTRLENISNLNIGCEVAKCSTRPFSAVMMKRM